MEQIWTCIINGFTNLLPIPTKYLITVYFHFIQQENAFATYTIQYIESQTSDNSWGMFLQPSEIRFSQDSIGNTFGRYTSHPYKPIGETLDDIISGSVTSLPDISVTMINGLWYTADNRRLWVLQQAEQCGEIDDIYVSLTDEIDPNKLTTENHGISVKVRGDPGGRLWKRILDPDGIFWKGSCESDFCVTSSLTQSPTVVQSPAVICDVAEIQSLEEDKYKRRNKRICCGIISGVILLFTIAIILIVTLA